MSKMNQEGQKTFREIYKTMDNMPPKLAFVKRIAEVTMKSETTVRCWLAGSQQPDALGQSVIEKELGISADILFPKKETEPCEQ